MIDEFNTYLDSGKVREKDPDKGKAKGLLKNAEEDLRVLKGIGLTEENASFIFKNSYDACRSILEALLANEGYKSYSHEAAISYSEREGVISRKESERLDDFRELRNDINYRGDKAEVGEAEEMIEMAEDLLKEVGEKVS